MVQSSDGILPTDVGGFERGLQRACGIGLAAFVVQALAVVVAGHQLYPLWWFLGPGPVTIGAVCVVVAACVRGRSRASGRITVVVICAVGCVLTALATADTVTRIGTAVGPLVTGLVGLLGLMERPAVALPVGVGLAGSQIVSMALTRPLNSAEIVLVAFIQCGFLVGATVGGLLARRGAAAQDRAAERLNRALVADRAAAVSRSDRREQERELHDTVLSTLTALARGSLIDSGRLRDRCAADARFLHALRLRDEEAEPAAAPDLEAELRRLARDASEPGFLVTARTAGTAATPPPGPVVRAIVRAAREAVANATRHSGTDRVEMRLTITGSSVRVEVVDQGRGAPAADDRPIAGDDEIDDMPGLGVRRSITERMADVGGRGVVERDPHRGTLVVLTWPR